MFVKNIIKKIKVNNSYFFNIIFCKKIVVISSSLQMLNLAEFIYTHKYLKKNFSDFIILCPYMDNRILKIIKKCNQKFVKRKNLIFDVQEGIQIKFLYLIILIRTIFNLKLDQIIIGNYNSYLNQKYSKISKDVYILDDGTNLLDKKHLKLIKKSKYYFFSFFEKKFFREGYYEKNEFKLLKNKFPSKKKYSKNILILGAALIERNYLNEDKYYQVIKYIEKKYKNKNLYYFPHPKENLDRIKRKFKSIKVLKSDYPIEIYILKMSKFPKTIVSFNSSAVIPLKSFNKDLDIFNLFLKVKPRNDNQRIFVDRAVATEKYFSKISIKTKTLQL
jgi:hypothetical protein